MSGKHRKHMVGTCIAPNGTRQMLFAYVRPDGYLTCVVEAASVFDAWVIATGWGSAEEIADQEARGWKMLPCRVEYTTWEPDTPEAKARHIKRGRD